MRADLRREAAAVIAAKPASALLYDSAVWCLVWVCGRVGVLCGGMGDAMGYKIRFRLTFSTGFASRIAQSKKVASKLLFDCGRKPDWASVEKSRFRLTSPTV